MLKILIVLVFISTILATKTHREMLHAADEKCQGLHNVTYKEINDLYDQFPGDTDKVDRNYKCFIKCVMDELNLKEESGKNDFKQAAEVYYPPNSNATEVAADCAAKHDSETDECERDFKTVACMVTTLRTKKDHEGKSD